MVDNEYSTEGCKSPKIRIGAVMKNREMLKFLISGFWISKFFINF